LKHFFSFIGEKKSRVLKKKKAVVVPRIRRLGKKKKKKKTITSTGYKERKSFGYTVFYSVK
jgi:hypothetical protein